MLTISQSMSNALFKWILGRGLRKGRPVSHSNSQTRYNTCTGADGLNLGALLGRAAAGVGVRWRLPFAEVRQAVLGPAEGFRECGL